MAAPGGRVERIREILRLVRYLAVAKLHDAHREGALALVGDDVLGHPQMVLPDDAPHLEPGGLTGMMAAKRLEVMPPVNHLA